VTLLAMQLAEQAAPELVLDPELEYGFFLHDLGKIGVPDEILRKPGPLDPAEFDVMRRHPVLGEGIISQIPRLNGVTRQVVRSHHERWDGAGYPDGLRGEEIPTAARIFSLVDAFDAMTNDRPYRRALPVETAVVEIKRGAGKQFDPQVAGLFVEFVSTLRNVA
jgi:HD-GYP domain-containing protein (c-di-GMP phosphodiesterase class II)